MSVIPFRLARVSVLAAFFLAALFAPSAVLAHDNEGHHDGKGQHEHGDRGNHGEHGDDDRGHGKGRDDDHGHGDGHGTKDEDGCVDHRHMRPAQSAEGKKACPATEQPAAAPAPSTGVTASAPSVSPPPAALPPCTSKRYFKITLGKRRVVRRARVLLNGRAVTVSYGKRNVKARIDLRGRVKGTYVVRTIVVTKSLRIKTRTRRYRVCGG